MVLLRVRTKRDGEKIAMYNRIPLFYATLSIDLLMITHSSAVALL